MEDFFSGEYWKNNSIEMIKVIKVFRVWTKLLTPVFSVKRRKEF